jgi:hypothetical protein
MWTPFATIFASLLVQACSGGGAQTTRDAGHDSGSPPPRTYAPTMTAIYDQILNSRCAQPFCHLGVAGSPPIFTDKEASYLALVNAPASGMKCGGAGAGDAGAGEAGAGEAGADDAGAGWVLVVPGDPQSSLLYRKIETPIPADLCGDPMPGGGQRPLDARDIQQIQQWITQGAMDN